MARLGVHHYGFLADCTPRRLPAQICRVLAVAERESGARTPTTPRLSCPSGTAATPYSRPARPNAIHAAYAPTERAATDALPTLAIAATGATTPHDNASNRRWRDCLCPIMDSAVQARYIGVYRRQSGPQRWRTSSLVIAPPSIVCETSEYTRAILRHTSPKISVSGSVQLAFLCHAVHREQMLHCWAAN